MSGRSKRLSQALCAVLANRQQSVGEIVALLATHSIEPLANGRRNGCSQGFSGALRELFCQSMRLRILDIQSHCYTILPLGCNHSTIAFLAVKAAVGKRAIICVCQPRRAEALTRAVRVDVPSLGRREPDRATDDTDANAAAFGFA